MKILVINGPNLNLLGTREPDIYGSLTYDGLCSDLVEFGKTLDVEISTFQSNIEGELVDEIQKTGFSFDGIIINPAAYTHTSVAIGDAIAAITTPVIEIHISNIFSREEFRKFSYVSAKSVGVISGLGMKGYELAVNYFIDGKLQFSDKI